MTYKEIEIKYGISYSVLVNRVKCLNLKGKFKGKYINFSREQVKQLLCYETKRAIKKRSRFNHRVKLSVIEFYERGMKAREIAELLNLNKDRKDIYTTIREYNETGCITVESKMNREEV